MAVVEQKLIIPYSPRDVFKPFHFRPERWSVLVAHRRAGKTVACINDLIRRAFVDGKADGRYAYVAPYHSQAKSVAWDYLLRYTAEVRSKANTSELWVELINGARIRLFGADNPDALRGLYLDGIILDEYADMRPRVWGEIIRPLLADREGWAVFIGTPKGHNGFYEIWRTAMASESWFARMIKASESQLIKPSELEDAARTMSDDQYEQEFECSFEAAILGAYYGKDLRKLESEGRICEVLWDRQLPVHTAWDLGYHDDTAIWFYQVTQTEIHVIDFYSDSGKTIDAYIDELETKPYRYGKDWLPHDARAKTLASGGRSVIEQVIKRRGIHNVEIVPDLSVQDGIQAARVMLRRCWFDEQRTGQAVELLKQYQREWDEDKKTFREKPRHDFTSHCADAFRYMAVAWQKLPVEKPVDKILFPIISGPDGKMRTSQTVDELWKDTPIRQEKRY